MWWMVVLGTVVVLIGASVLMFLPDIRRYLRMRSM